VRQLPPRVSSSLPAVRPVGRTGSQRFHAPSATSPGLAPCEAGRHPHLGSALRVPPPPSGFVASPSFATLFHAAAAPGVLSLQRFPPTGVARPSRGRLLPGGHPPASSDDAAADLSPPVSSTPAAIARCSRPIPPTTMGSLSTAPVDEPSLARRRSKLSGPPGPPRREPRSLADFTRFEALILRLGPFASTEVARCRRPILSWCSASPESSPSTPGIL